MSDTGWLDTIEGNPRLGAIGETFQGAVQSAFQSGEGAREVEDALHGTWLGHPLHPAAVSVPLGAWTAAAAMDVLEMTGAADLRAGADAAIAVGLAGAVVAASSGLADWQYTEGKAMRVGLAHAMLNGAATLLFGASLVLRRTGSRRAGQAASLLGLAIGGASGWLGGYLVGDLHMGVDRATDVEPPEGWTAVMPLADLEDNRPTRVMAGRKPVVLVKRGRSLYAMAETCAHMGGPLSEGAVTADCIVCPWHGSAFRLEDGSLKRGPSAFPQPRFETRVRRGQVEVRPLT